MKVVKSVSKVKSKVKSQSKITSKVKTKTLGKVKTLSKVKVKSKKKFNVKVIKRVNNNLIFTYAKNAIRFGLPIVTYFSLLYVLNKIENNLIQRRRNRNNPFMFPEQNVFVYHGRGGDFVDHGNGGRRVEQLQRNAEDRQNVHDRQVNQQSIDIYNRYPIPRNETVHNAINQMRRMFRNDRIVLTIINRIVERNHGGIFANPIAGLNRTELQCLTTVFTNVVDNEDKKNYFSQMLRDCAGDYNGLVCQTGVVNRIVVALLVDNPDAIPRNFRLEFANELQNLAIRIRNQVLENDNLQTDEEKQENFKIFYVGKHMKIMQKIKI